MGDSEKPADRSSERREGECPEFHEESLPVLDSAELFRGQREVLICHQGNLYRLRVTRAGKLILHK